MLKNLGDIANGKKTIAFALTEPDAGSDASAIKALAVRHGDGFVISGRKMFITNGAIADLVTVLALTDPEKRARGGILCAFMDHVIGQSVCTLVRPEARLITLEMSLKFIEAVWPEGQDPCWPALVS